MNEWEFTAAVAHWITQYVDGHRDLPFGEARAEQQAPGNRQRRDLTLAGRDGRPVLTGEVKLPYARDGRTPYADAVVRDARGKARKAGTDYFFTWNVIRFALWQTEPPAGTDAATEAFRSWELPGVAVATDAHLTSPLTQDAVRDWLGTFLPAFARILAGDEDLARKPPDERFVEKLEAALDAPIRLTVGELAARRKRPAFKRDLNAWMRDEQGWTIDESAEGVRTALDRAARFACYVAVNRLVFYEALLKRYGAALHRIDVPDHVDTADGLRGHLEGFFEDARRVTRDYETVFGETAAAFGNRIPFLADGAVDAWRDLVGDIHAFDFAKLDYDVIGGLFERLIDPAERHRFGQYYTRPEVVDLLNSFAVRTADAAVMDPACGGGTFLVRAYVRKREMGLSAGAPPRDGRERRRREGRRQAGRPRPPPPAAAGGTVRGGRVALRGPPHDHQPRHPGPRRG